MGRRPKKTFLQRRHTDGQKAHENMFSIASYERNANQNYSEISPHTCQNGYHQKQMMESLQITNIGEGEKREPSYTVGGNVIWCM